MATAPRTLKKTGQSVRRRKRMLRSKVVIWFRREDYDAIRRLIPNEPNLPNTFDEWFEAATRQAQKLNVPHAVIRKTIINPKEFAAYCNASGVDHSWTILIAFAVLVDRQNQERRERAVASSR